MLFSLILKTTMDIDFISIIDLYRKPYDYGQVHENITFIISTTAHTNGYDIE